MRAVGPSLPRLVSTCLVAGSQQAHHLSILLLIRLPSLSRPSTRLTTLSKFQGSELCLIVLSGAQPSIMIKLRRSERGLGENAKISSMLMQVVDSFASGARYTRDHSHVALCHHIYVRELGLYISGLFRAFGRDERMNSRKRRVLSAVLKPSIDRGAVASYRRLYSGDKLRFVRTVSPTNATTLFCGIEANDIPYVTSVVSSSKHRSRILRRRRLPRAQGIATPQLE
jgi:hypothetical protein